MTPTDWSQVDSMEPSTDLFAGDILGDELIDIYNAAVVGGGGGDDEAINEIPTLLSPVTDTVKKEDDTDAASIDDGLGAFRPSTSFNDLSAIYPGSVNATGEAKKTGPGVVSVKMEDDIPTETKKRVAAAAPANAPAPKRRASPGTKKSAASSKSKSKATSGQSKSKATKGSSENAKKDKKDTPNPLTTTSANPPPPPAAVATAASVANANAAAVSGTQTKTAAKAAAGVAPVAPAPIVTPMVQTKVTETPAVATAPAPPSLSSASPTEADFKSVAQAAVSNLIMNAGNPGKPESPASGTNGEAPMTIDTSTEHIKALTGTNWVAVCSGGDVGQDECAAADKLNNRARRQNLTPDERARQNRDRNREHARNTRLRKKAYVEELKRTLTALVSQRDAAELEKRHSAQRELEQREVRFRVIEEFLKLRGRNEVNFPRWAAILEENFTLVLPCSDFIPGAPRTDQNQILSGVSEAMAESNAFSSFLQSLGKENSEISFVYNCDRTNFFMDNCVAVLDWSASSHGAVQQGAPQELTLKGSLKAKFSPASNKLISVAMTFDTGIIASQLNNVFKVNDVSNDEVDAAEAAQVAACEADAILDSLQMPLIAPTSIPSNVTIKPTACAGTSGPASITDVEKEDSSDESNHDSEEAMTTRRVLRRKE